MAINGFTALSRFGLGSRPGDLEEIGGDLKGAILADMSDGEADDGALQNLLPDTPQAVDAVLRAEEARKNGDVSAAQVPAKLYRDEITARLQLFQSTPVGFRERLVAFWANHFAVAASKSSVVRALAGTFEREAIRPHVFGRFDAMLDAATRHPAMLAYLDNAVSIGPGSPAGERQNRGINENHARELLELHTVGVGAGYSQADVIALANVLTGWSFGRSLDRPQNLGRFVFRKAAHQPGPQRVMGVAYSTGGEEQGIDVLSALAKSPATARHLAFELARHFVADNPPPALVDTLTSSYAETGGDLGAVTRTLVLSDEAWDAPPTKVKTPQEFIWSALRAVDPPVSAQEIVRDLRTLGEPMWDPPSPQGFKDTSDVWLAPNAFTQRVDIADRFAQKLDELMDVRRLARELFGDALAPDTSVAIARAELARQGIVLALMSPEFQRR